MSIVSSKKPVDKDKVRTYLEGYDIERCLPFLFLLSEYERGGNRCKQTVEKHVICQ